MGLSYPIAKNADAALRVDETQILPTKSHAEALCGSRVTLTTEWVTLASNTSETFSSLADKAKGYGYAQIYENKDGDPVWAITFWKIISTAEAKAEDLKEEEEQAARAEENTDDIYFTRPDKRRERFGRAIHKPRVKKPDPRQMNLFPAPGRPMPEKPPNKN